MSSTLWPVQRSLSEITVLNCPMITSFFYFRWKAACDVVLCSVSLEFFIPCDCIALFTVCYAPNIKEIGGAYCFWVVCPFATLNSPARYLKKEGQCCPVSLTWLPDELAFRFRNCGKCGNLGFLIGMIEALFLSTSYAYVSNQIWSQLVIRVRRSSKT